MTYFRGGGGTISFLAKRITSIKKEEETDWGYTYLLPVLPVLDQGSDKYGYLSEIIHRQVILTFLFTCGDLDRFILDQFT